MNAKHNASYYLVLGVITFPFVVLAFSIIAGTGLGLYWLLCHIFPADIAQVIVISSAVGTVIGTFFHWGYNDLHV